MANRTKGEIVSDVELRLTRSIPSDDFDIDREQIAHWLDTSANSIVSDLIARQGKSGNIDPFYLKTTQPNELLSVSKEGTLNNARYYIDISGFDILSVHNGMRDIGINTVRDSLNKILVPVKEDDLDFYKDLKFSAPSKDNLMWYREGDRIFIAGISDTSKNQKKFKITYIPTIDSRELDDEDEYPVTQEILPIIVDLAEEIGLQELSQGIYDVENDGKA